MNCPYCGNEFNKSFYQRKYCSIDCQLKYRRRTDKVKAWDRTSEERRRDALTDSMIKKAIYIVSKGIIKYNQITPEMIEEKRGQIQAYRQRCEAIKAEREANPPAPKEATRVCVVCGNTFDVKGKSLVCGDRCRNIDGMNKYYANQDAILAATRAKYWEERQEREPFECKECGKAVVPKYETGDSRRTEFCSVRCGKRYSHRARGSSHVTRARYFGVDCEAVDPIKVFMRDGWRCQLCHKKLRRINRGTIKDTAPELDHIIPLSKGGEHSYRNTQCVCRKCNSDKGAQERGQLRMFG